MNVWWKHERLRRIINDRKENKLGDGMMSVREECKGRGNEIKVEVRFQERNGREETGKKVKGIGGGREWRTKIKGNLFF